MNEIHVLIYFPRLPFQRFTQETLRETRTNRLLPWSRRQRSHPGHLQLHVRAPLGDHQGLQAVLCSVAL